MAEQGAPRTVGSWSLVQHIGSGSFAVVWRARHVESGQEAAVKEINLSKLNAKLKQSLESEVSILKRINHENIVKLHEVLEEGDRLFLVMEYCAGGDLAHFLRRVKRVPEATARHLMRQLAAGLRQMWAHHLVHRDLKPQNLLLSAPTPDATLKIADFGFARNLQPQGLAETLCGSPLYMAPEILHFHKYDAKADLWSIGAILFELVVGRPPFTGANQFQLLRNIERGDARLPEALAAALSPPCRHLIHCLLRRNPVERLSFEEFFRHPFVATPEEAAAPLPPRTPLGAGPAAAAAAVAARGGQPLLFSTSAPPAVAPPPLAKPRSTGSIPQQVLGFRQAAAPPSQRPGGGGGPASPAATAVPLGGLSHQLKTRRSLDLEVRLAAQRSQQEQQQGQQRGQQEAAQRRPQPVPGHRLGSFQRVQGFQPAPPPGQLPTHGSPTAAAALAAVPQPQAAAATGPPGGVPAAGGRLGGSSGAQGGGPQPPASVASEDEDYVLVDAMLSAHTAAGRSSRQGSPPRNVSRCASAEGSLAGSRHTSGSADEGVFAVAAGDGAAGDGGGGSGPAAAPSWLGTPRWRFLHRVARILQAAAAARQGAAAVEAHPLSAAAHAALRECLSLHLAALQLLERSMEAHAAALAAADAAQPAAGELGEGPAAEVKGGDGLPAAPPQAAACDAREVAAASLALQQDAAASMAAADAAAAALDKAGRQPSPTAVTPAAAALEEADAALPDPWELLYAAALGWGREAAVDELLGSAPRSCRLYARAGTALSFLCAEGAGLGLEPPLELAPADRLRLHKYAAATAARWAACAAAVGDGGAAGGTAA